MIEIDGSEGEGGGQILRSALALSILTRRTFKLVNIRARRNNPGLRPQHLACVKAAAQISGSTYKGGTIGSAVLVFEPGICQAGSYRFAVGTAGATALVLQTVALPLALRGQAESQVTITGGTHVMAAPCYHFLESTWAPWLGKLGVSVELELIRHGFYPRGGGEIQATIQPAKCMRSLHTLTAPQLTTAGGFAATADLPDSVAKTMSKRLRHKLNLAGLESHIPQEAWLHGPAAVVAVLFRQLPVPASFFALGERGKPAEAVADEAAEQAIAFKDSGCPVDPHSADQLVLPLAFADGESEFRTSEVTQHLLTNITTIQRFVQRDITCHGDVGKPGLVRVGGRSA